MDTITALSYGQRRASVCRFCGVSVTDGVCGDGHPKILKIFILQTITLRGFNPALYTFLGSGSKIMDHAPVAQYAERGVKPLRGGDEKCCVCAGSSRQVPSLVQDVK